MIMFVGRRMTRASFFIPEHSAEPTSMLFLFLWAGVSFTTRCTACLFNIQYKKKARILLGLPLIGRLGEL